VASIAESEGSFLTSGLFQGADALFTNAVINQATEVFLAEAEVVDL
jgi:hypothetical protein